MDSTGLRKIYEATRVPICFYQGKELIFSRPENYAFQYADSDPGDAVARLYITLHNFDTPLLFFEEDQLYYGAFSSGPYAIILGPVSFIQVDFGVKRSFQHRHNFPEAFPLMQMSGKRFRAVLALAYYAVTGEDAEPDAFPVANLIGNTEDWNPDADMEHYDLERSEYERDHNSMEYEQKLLKLVREGNVEAIEQFAKGASQLEREHVGIVSRDRKKQEEYLCVTLLSMLARTAAEGGMNQEKAFSMADVYLQRLSACSTVEEMQVLTSKATYEFTVAVRQSRQKDSRNHHVEACKSYVQNNLRRPFQISEISESLGINRSYLARKFSQSEGISIQEYVLRERCKHAENLLKHSDYSIAMIAEYFCFSSQSHFGKVFKAYSSMTPLEYRNRYKRS